MKTNKSTIAMAMMLGMMPFFPVDLRELTAPSVRHEWKKSKGPTPNKFNRPHQGAKECERRVRQNSGERLESRPRRMWGTWSDFGWHRSSTRAPLVRLSFDTDPVVLLP